MKSYDRFIEIYGDETKEPMRRFVTARPKANKSRRKKPDTVPYKKIRRMLDPEHSVKFSESIADHFGSELPPGCSIGRQLGVSLLTQNVAAHVLKIYAPLQVKNPYKTFNKIIDRHVEEINFVNPLLFLKLGKAAVFNSYADGRKRYHAGFELDLTADSSFALLMEQVELIKAVLPNHKNEHNDAFQRSPHISAISTYDADNAEICKTALEELDISKFDLMAQQAQAA